jgi:hypothetical protein
MCEAEESQRGAATAAVAHPQVQRQKKVPSAWSLITSRLGHPTKGREEQGIAQLQDLDF